MAPSIAAVPERSLQQRLDSLAIANQVRTRRARIKRDIKAGRRSIYDVLRSADPSLQTAAILDLVLCIPKVGRVKAMSALNTARVSPTRTLGALTARQRLELAVTIARATARHRPVTPRPAATDRIAA